MSETLHLPAQAPEIAEQTSIVLARTREEQLHKLLPYDFEYAEKSGLVDMFYYNPETGEDGLTHTLAGNVVSGEGGASLVEGFHHAPSGELVGPIKVEETSGKVLTTGVDAEHVATLRSKKREAYKHYPLEPYRAKVAVAGLTKYAIREDTKTGEKSIAPAKNSMFPDEYDALAVMQAVRQAKDDPNGTEYLSKDDRGQDIIVSEGNATLMDGKTQMPIRVMLDPATRKVKTAIPIINQRPGFMKLTAEQADQIPVLPESYQSNTHEK